MKIVTWREPGKRQAFDEIEKVLTNTIATWDNFKNCVVILGYDIMSVQSVIDDNPNAHIIIYQLEPLKSIDSKYYKYLLSKLKLVNEVWDYDTSNVDKLISDGINAKLAPLWGHDSIKFNLPIVEKDIDVLIYGSPSPRRDAIKQRMYSKYRYMKVVDVCNFWGDELNTLINRSKIVLNVHRLSPDQIQEQARLIPLVFNNACVVSETSPTNYMGNSIIHVPYDSIVDTCHNVLQSGSWKEFGKNTVENFEDFYYEHFHKYRVSKYKKTVYTCIIGEYDTVQDPLVINREWDYVCYTNNPNLHSAIWNIKQISSKVLDDTRLARRVKILYHRHVSPNKSPLSIWIDGNFKIRDDVHKLVERMDLSKVDLYATQHGRDCIYEEGVACIDFNKDSDDVINPQMEKYRAEGYPEHNGLISSGVLVRKHSPKLQAMHSTWWKEVKRHSKRDQLSFNYACWKHDDFKYGMMKIQTRDSTFALLQHKSRSKFAVIMCNWKRTSNIPAILKSLSAQTYKQFKVYIWNNNILEHDDVISLVNRYKGNLSIQVIKSVENLKGRARFVCANELYKQGLQYAVFIDDDQIPGPEFMSNMIAYANPKMIASWWAYKLKGAYMNRDRVTNGKVADYLGTGGMVLDVSIFGDTQFWDEWDEYYYDVEDLWLSHYATNKGWRCIGINPPLQFLKNAGDKNSQYLDPATSKKKDEFVQKYINGDT